MLRERKSAGRRRVPFAPRITDWSVRRRRWAIGLWLGLVALSVLAGALVSGPDVPNRDPGDSGRTQQILATQNSEEPVRESVLVQSLDPASPRLDRRAVDDLTARLRATPSVTGLLSPTEPGGARLVSADGVSGLVTFQLAGTGEQIESGFDAVVKTVGEVGARHSQVRFAQAGDLSLSAAVDENLSKDMDRSALISVSITVALLILVFGSLIAAGIPLLLTMTVMAATFSLLAVVNKVLPVNSASYAMILLVGVAVGVDYSLFYLRRHREERLAGRNAAEALRVTSRTSGHVVLVSGLTVMLCMTGFMLTGLSVFIGTSVGMIVVVGLAMTGSVTVVPALLAMLGNRVDRARVPWLGRTRARESRVWTAIARTVVRRPAVWGGTAVLALLVVALPALGMHLQDPAQTQSLPRSVPAVDAALRMQQAFPGTPTPARVVIWDSRGGSLDTAQLSRAIDGLHASVATSGGLLAEPISVVQVDHVLVARVPLAGAGTDATSDKALETLRNDVLPATFGQMDGIDYAVGGRTATPHDFAKQMTSRAPLVFAFVLVLAFGLLFLAFRSLAISVISILLNLLSIGAAYGVLTWVFQDGHLGGLLGFTAYGGVVGWLPMFMFVLLFGLSMDYHIFILSRIKERLAGAATQREAIVGGIGSGAGVVTSAATIMVAVFTVFIALTAIEYKMLGVGMAVAILIDATVVRGVLLPAALTLVGKRGWGRG
jgi:RND superfamily putative drug exporter